MAYQFPIVRATGPRYEIGVQVGEAFRDKIPRAIDQIFDYELTIAKNWTKGDSPPIPDFTREDVLKKTKEFLPLFEEYCPSMIEEIHGIAKGARFNFGAKTGS